MSQEDVIRQQYQSLLAAYTKVFPTIVPPESRWWIQWMSSYNPETIREAILRLSLHPLRDSFTSVSTSKAITATLKQIALQQAVASVPTQGRSHE